MKVFTDQDQRDFAVLSGDWNPMHMDAVAARRTQAGAPVVHGIHALLWAGERLLAELPGRGRVVRLTARFLKWIYVGAEVEILVQQADHAAIRAQIRAHGMTAVSFQLELGAAGSSAAASPAQEWSRPEIAATPLEPGLESLGQQCGEVAFATDPAALAQAFPALARHLGVQRLAGLAATSRLVGMVCPGLHSLFASLDLDLRPGPSPASVIQFQASAFDPRFRRLTLEVRGAGLEGEVVAFARVPPVRQGAFAEIAGRVMQLEFQESDVLILGGSRGLGEVTAKLIAAGGGTVLLTYAVGRGEAESVAAEIHAGGGHCQIMAYDVRKPALPQLAAMGRVPDQVYYFATPPIHKPKAGLFDPVIFNGLAQHYLVGLAEVGAAMRSLRPNGWTLFYPSSVFVGAPQSELIEYAMAKAAGEVLCGALHRPAAGMRVVVKRLPRLPTDQTAGLAASRSDAAIETLLPILREMQASRRHTG